MFTVATALPLLVGVCLVNHVQGSVPKGVKNPHPAASWKTNHFHAGKIFKRATNPHDAIMVRQYPLGETRSMGDGILRQIPITYESRQFPRSDEMHPRTQGRTIGPIVDKISEGIANGLSVGLSTGITSGITNGVYALPDAIAGTVQNLKQGQLGGVGGGIHAGGAPYGGVPYFSPIKGGSFSYGAPSDSLYGASLSSGLGHGLPYAAYSKPYSGYAPMSSAFSSGFSGIHSGSPSLYSTQGLSSNVYTAGISPYFNKNPIISSLNSKPIGGSEHVAPAAPYHWDCKLVPALYGNRLGYKDAGDDKDNEVDNLSRLIQEAGMNNDQMRILGVPHSSEFTGEARMVKDGQPIRIVGLPKSAELQGMDGLPMMSSMGNYRDNLLRDLEELKNFALLEEMNMSLPPLGMIDPNKLVDSGDIMEYPIHNNQQQGGETPFMMMLIPMTNDMIKQEPQHMASGHPQAAVGQQVSDGHNQVSEGQHMSGVPQGMQGIKQEKQQEELKTQTGNVANQEKQQQDMMMQQQHNQKAHEQIMQSDEPIGAGSIHVESTAKPESDVKKPATSGKGKTIVHDELRQSEQENLIE